MNSATKTKFLEIKNQNDIEVVVSIPNYNLMTKYESNDTLVHSPFYNIEYDYDADVE